MNLFTNMLSVDYNTSGLSSCIYTWTFTAFSSFSSSYRFDSIKEGLCYERGLEYWLLLVFPQYHQVPDEYFTSAVVLSLILAALFGLVYLLIIPQCVQQIHFLSFFRSLSTSLMLPSIPLTCLSFDSGARLYSYSSSSAYASCWLVSCTCMSHGSRYDYQHLLVLFTFSLIF